MKNQYTETHEQAFLIRDALEAVEAMRHRFVEKNYPKKFLIFTHDIQYHCMLNKYKNTLMSADTSLIDKYINDGANLLNTNYKFKYLNNLAYYVNTISDIRFIMHEDHLLHMPPLTIAIILGDENATKALIKANVDLDMPARGVFPGTPFEQIILSYNYFLDKIEPLKDRTASRMKCLKLLIDANSSITPEYLSSKMAEYSDVFDENPELKRLVLLYNADSYFSSGTQSLLTTSFGSIQADPQPYIVEETNNERLSPILPSNTL